MKDFKSVEDAAKYLGITGSGVRKAIKEGRLAAGRIGKVHIINQKDLERYKASMGDRCMERKRLRKTKK
jgi:excisionase family DNA binding protein